MTNPLLHNGIDPLGAPKDSNETPVQPNYENTDAVNTKLSESQKTTVELIGNLVPPMEKPKIVPNAPVEKIVSTSTKNPTILPLVAPAIAPSKNPQQKLQSVIHNFGFVPNLSFLGNAWNRIVSSRAGRSVSEGVQEYRKIREGSIMGPIDNIARTGGVGYGTYLLADKTWQFFANALARGDILFEYGAVPLAGVGSAAALLGVRRWLDNRRYRNHVEHQFEAYGDDAKMSKEHDSHEAIHAMREFIEEKEHEDSRELLSNNDELTLLQALHHIGTARPAEAPMLRTTAQYAEYCFTRFSDLCETAYSNWQRGVAMHGLKEDQVKKLAEYFLGDPNLTDDEKETKRNSLLEMSIVYGRLLQEYHSDKREGQVRGALWGSAISAAPLSGYLSLALAGGVHLLRNKYRKDAKKHNHLEIRADGKLSGKRIPGTNEYETVMKLEVAREGEHFFDHSEFHDYHDTKKEDLSEKARTYWWNLIKIPHGIKAKTADELGEASAAMVLNSLLKKDDIRTPATEAEKALKKIELDEANGTLVDLRKELQELPGEIRALEDQKTNREARKEEACANLKDQTKVAQVAKGYQDDIDRIQERIIKSQARLDEVRGIPEMGTKPAKEGLYAAQMKTVAEKASALKVAENGADPGKLKIERALENPDIRAVFYVKVHQAFNHQQETQKKAGFFAGLGYDALDWMKSKAKDAGDAVGSGVLAGAVLGPLIGVGSAYTFPALNALKVGGVAGAGVALLVLLSKFIKGRPASHGSQKPAEKHH